MAEEYKVHVHSKHSANSANHAKRKLVDKLRSALEYHADECIGVRSDMRSNSTYWWWTIILPNQYIHGRIETEESNEHFA